MQNFQIIEKYHSESDGVHIRSGIEIFLQEPLELEFQTGRNLYAIHEAYVCHYLRGPITNPEVRPPRIERVENYASDCVFIETGISGKIFIYGA